MQSLAEQYKENIRLGRVPHAQVAVRLRGEDVLIDERIVNVVQMLNSFGECYTISSCQGCPSMDEASTYSGHFALKCESRDWRVLSEFAFEKIAPLMQEADTGHQVVMACDCDPVLWITFAFESIPAIECVLSQIRITEAK